MRRLLVIASARYRAPAAAVVALGVLAAVSAVAAADRPEHPLTLEEAIRMALQKNEAIVIERENLESAKAIETGTLGAYDPVFSAYGSWSRATLPVNSAFSGAPSGEDSPTTESTGAAASLSQYVATGVTVTFSVPASRDTTNGIFTLLSPVYMTRAGVEFRQPLLRDRETDPARSAMLVASADRRRAAASLQREVSDSVAQVETAYWRLVAAQQAVAVLEESVRLAAEQLEQTRLRVEKGAAPETEISQPKAELERRRGDSLAVREAAMRADSALKLLILGDEDAKTWSERLVPADDPGVEISDVDVEREMEHALASRPELKEAEALREQRRLASALARDAVHPSLDAVASYNRYGLAGGRNPDGVTISGQPVVIPNGMEGSLGTSLGMLGDNRFDDARVGLEFRMPFRNRAAEAIAAVGVSAERQADADLTRARKQVRAEILDAAAALETAGQRIEAARSAREAAEVQLSAEKDRYEVGLSTNFLVLTRQNDLSRARLDEIAALTEYRMASAEMARATGSLLDDRGIEIDSGDSTEE